MDSDQKLIANYLAGDEKSLEVLIKRYLKPIYSFVYRYVGDGEVAEDITQEVFVKVWRNLKKFDPRRKTFGFLRGRQNKSPAPYRTCSGAGFKTWIFHIAKNTSFDFLKKKKAIPFSEFENEEGENKLIETLADPTPLPSKLLERAGIEEMLNAAINQLAPKYRMVLFLRYNDHFTFREITEVFGEPLNTVKSRHRRALIILKRLLSDS